MEVYVWYFAVQFASKRNSNWDIHWWFVGSWGPHHQPRAEEEVHVWADQNLPSGTRVCVACPTGEQPQASLQGVNKRTLHFPRSDI